MLGLTLPPQKPVPYFAAPSGREYARVVPGGTTILPNGRFLTPVGERIYTSENLWKVLSSPDGKTLVGFAEDELTIVTGGGSRRLPMKGVAPAGVFLPDGRLLVSLGDASKVAILQAGTYVQGETIDTGVDSHIVDLAYSSKSGLVYALDVANQKLLTLDPVQNLVVARSEAGRQPYALALSPDAGTLFVANIGLFDYSLVPPAPNAKDPRGLTRPPFGYPSQEARHGLRFEDRDIPGLGDPHVPDAQSVWQYSLVDPRSPRAMRKVKTGLLIRAISGGGEDKVMGGSSPNALLLHGDRLFVANANNDTVQEFRARDLELQRTIRLTAGPGLENFRGLIPSGMALDRRKGRLYVCESGLNSVAVHDVTNGRLLGRIPTGWFPLSLSLSSDGRTLSVATQKGLGRGPRGALHPRPKTDERFGFPDMPGMIQRLQIPGDAELKRGDREARRNAGYIASTRPTTSRVFSITPGQPSAEIRHVVFITKENHTFDGIFGGLPGSRSEPAYAEFGRNGWIKEKGKTERLPIMPNHIALAERFAIGDNFYMEPQASGDGHRWLVGVYPSLWTTRLFYAGWDFRRTPQAKGRYVSFGSNGSQIPEDYLENGSIWEHLDRNRMSFRNYGEGFEFPGVDEGAPKSRTGAGEVVNFPMPKALFDNTCFEYPIYNTNIPDIARADWFREDMDVYRQKNGAMPRFTNIAICNDHGDKPRPEFGYPYVASYMADNDLALGRIVEYLSHLPEWKSMAIFITQDDSGGDDDSVDRHRSFVLHIGPYAKRSYVGHDHTSIMSIVRSVYALLGLGANNLFDAAATPLHDLFTDTPDFTPYTHVPSDPRVFRPEATIDPNDPKFEKRRGMQSVRMDDPAFFEWLRNRG